MENGLTPRAMTLILRQLVSALLGDRVLSKALKIDPTTRLGGKTHYLLRARVRLAKRMLRAWLHVQAKAVAYVPREVTFKIAKPTREITEKRVKTAAKFTARVKLYQTRRKDKRAPDPKRTPPPMLDEVREWLFAEVESLPRVVAVEPPKPAPKLKPDSTPKAGQLAADLQRIAAILDAPDRAVQRVAQRLAPPENYADRLRKWRFAVVEPVAPSAVLIRKLGALCSVDSESESRRPTPQALSEWWDKVLGAGAIKPQPLPD